MNDDVVASYRIRLRSLQWASSLLRQLSHTNDEEAVLVAANWALSTVYDLSEAYWKLHPTVGKGVVNQDAHFTSCPGGERVGGLLVARGKMTHELATVSAVSAFRTLPYDFAKLTDWAWAAPTWQTGDLLDGRTEWYRQHAYARPLWVPLEQAEWWFVENGPTFVTGEAVTASGDWVEGVSPDFLERDELTMRKNGQLH